MNRTANADSFRQALLGIDKRYLESFKPQLDLLQAQLASGKLPAIPLIDESREIHARTYVVNAWLAALNWRMTTKPEEGLPNLVPESAVVSSASGTQRFMDYLGFERMSLTLTPLLIVETKRPRIELPELVSATDPQLSREEVLSLGLQGNLLTGDWNKWLSHDVGDYVRSVHEKTKEAPARVVITNGDWLILFWDPADAFLPGGSKAPERIAVWKSRAAIVQRAGVLFEKLEHSRVLRGARPVATAELPFLVDGNDIDAVMHGVHLRYDEEPGIHLPPVPRIKVAPVVFLRSRFGSWFCVEAGNTDYPMPLDATELLTHISAVRKAAESLLVEVNARLGTSLVPRGVSAHYSDDAAFSVIRGVRAQDLTDNKFLLVTGSETHFFRRSALPGCPFHDYAEANKIGRAASLVNIRATKPRRAFFRTQEEQHCAHGDVAVAKESSVTAENEGRCGPRSRGRGSAFCEIWPFETQLCCRACVFEHVCTKAKAFQLPCSTHAQ